MMVKTKVEEPKIEVKQVKDICDLDGVGPTTLEKLNNAGITTLITLAVTPPSDISVTAGITEIGARKLIKQARDAVKLGFEIAKDYAVKYDKNLKVKTGCPLFDNAIGGGFEAGTITEIYGTAASGKSTLAHIVISKFLMENPKAKAIYLDSLLYEQPTIIREKNIIKIVKIGEFIDKYYKENEEMSKKIKNVEVPTFKNGKIEWRHVDRVYRHENKEKKYRVTLKNGTSIDITSAHCLFTPIIQNKRLKKIKEIVPKTIDSLKINDYIALPKKINYKHTINKIDILEETKHIKTKLKKNDKKIVVLNTTTFPRILKLNNDLMKLLGWFLAEGHTNHLKNNSSRIVFTLNKNDVEGIKSCERFASKYNLSIFKLDRGSNYQIIITNKIIALLFDKWFNRGAKNKKVPDFIFNIKSNYIKTFIRAWIKGDGTYSINKEMINQINYLGLLIGERYCFYTKKQKISFIKGREILPSSNIYSIGTNLKDYFKYGDIFFCKIKSIKEIEYNKKYVYDFCVNDIHNFVGGYGGIFTHNTEKCFRPERMKDFTKDKYDDVMSRIFIARAYNFDHQMLLTDEIEKLVQTDNSYRIVIIDSLTSHIRAEQVGRGTLANRQQRLNTYIHQLMRMSDIYNLVLIVTNQVMSDPGAMYGDPNRPVGGNIVAHHVTTRIYLRQGKGGSTYFKLVDSQYLPPTDGNFKIGTDGITEVL